jgi:hypothetical protein
LQTRLFGFRRGCPPKLHIREIIGDRVEWKGRKEWEEVKKNTVNVTVEAFIALNLDYVT